MTEEPASQPSDELDAIASPERRANPFDRFAEATTQFVSRSSFFTITVILTVLWVPTIFLFESVDTWQLVYNTVVSALAFLLIALLQNSERRYDIALHYKMDALANGLADLMEHVEKEDPERLRRHAERLRASVKLERKI